jgi:Protein of unknown function (DUF3489)
MSKSVKPTSAKKRTVASSGTPVPAANPAQSTTGEVATQKSDPRSKQSRLIAMLQSPAGTTIAAMMKATGWQQHSVRGFLAGVVRKRLKLKLGSKKLDGQRLYQITAGGKAKAGSRPSKRQPT